MEINLIDCQVWKLGRTSLCVMSTCLKMLCCLPGKTEVPCTKCVFKGTGGSISLILAMRNDHKQCVNVWIESGADVNIADENGTTALFIAISKKELTTVKKLIEAGAEVNILNNKGNTPLREAVLDNFYTCLDPLLRAGADVNAVYTRKRHAYDMTTPLIDAVRHDNMNCVTILLEAGADVNKVCAGTVALHFAHHAHHTSYKCTELLLKAGADVNIADKCGHTALTLASLCGYHDTVELLINAGADVNHADIMRRLHFCLLMSVVILNP